MLREKIKKPMWDIADGIQDVFSKSCPFLDFWRNGQSSNARETYGITEVTKDQKSE